MIKNAKTLPEIYYGLHMAPGVAEYRDPGQDAYRILINEDTLKVMDTTFAGRPVYVRHVDEVNLDLLQVEADGYVIESFFNTADGKHWAKFIVVSDKGHEAIKIKKWRLSNAYMPKETIAGGLWHGVDYAKEVVRGEYEHLAIVPDPRYDESIILTPEEFKKYNDEKEIELKRLANSKGEESMFDFSKKTKVENSKDIESISVTLPKSKVEKTITQLINEGDEQEMEKKKDVKDCYANGEHKVKVGEEEMSVNELVEKHQALTAEHKEMKDSMMAEDPAEMEEKKSIEEQRKNDEDEMAKKTEVDKAKKNDDKKAEEDKKKNNFDKLKNAQSLATRDPIRVDLDKAARGKSRYGSST